MSFPIRAMAARSLLWAAMGVLATAGVVLPSSPAFAIDGCSVSPGVTQTDTTITGTQSNDTIICTNGVPAGATIRGNAGDDTITVTATGSRQAGNAGEIYGGVGNDAITITGASALTGGTVGHGNTGTVAGDEGVDIITVTGGADLSGLHKGGTGNTGTITNTDGGGTISVVGGAGGNGGIGNSRTSGSQGTISGGTGADILIEVTGGEGLSVSGTVGGGGGHGNQYGSISAGTGSDIVIRVTGGNGTRNGGAGQLGDPRLPARLNASTSGDGGNDTITVIGGNSPQRGGSGNNSGIINGGGGNDAITVNGGNGLEVNSGGTGNQVGTVNGGDGDDLITLTAGQLPGPNAKSNSTGGKVDGQNGTDTCNFVPANEATVTSCELGVGH